MTWNSLDLGLFRLAKLKAIFLCMHLKVLKCSDPNNWCLQLYFIYVLIYIRLISLHIVICAAVFTRLRSEVKSGVISHLRVRFPAPAKTSGKWFGNKELPSSAWSQRRRWTLKHISACTERKCGGYYFRSGYWHKFHDLISIHKIAILFQFQSWFD